MQQSCLSLILLMNMIKCSRIPRKCSFSYILDVFYTFNINILELPEVNNWKLHLQSISQFNAALNARIWHAKLHPSFNLQFIYTEKPGKKHTQTFLKEFTAGNFSVQRKLGSFDKVPSGQVIEQIINKDKNGSEGEYREYSTMMDLLNDIVSRLLCAFQ